MPSPISLAVTFAALTAAATGVNAAVPVWGQCGGNNYTGDKTCTTGNCCKWYSDWYSQCIPGSACGGTTVSLSTTRSTSTRTIVSLSTTGPSSTRTSTTPSSTPSNGLRGLHKLAFAKGRYFGSAIDQTWSNSDSAYLALTGNTNEFGVITPENSQKWESIHPSQTTYSYTNADNVVNWAIGKGQKIRGHTLVWHSQLAAWVSNSNFNNATLIQVIESHIANIGAHYKGKLYAWDVVNEPWNEDGTWRSSVFYNTIGPAFIPISLKAARLADPSAKLYLNDYNTDGINAKSTAMYNLASSLLSQGVPLDGIGIQGHLVVGTVPDMQANIQRFANLGLDVAITELDIRMTTPADSTKLAQQASDYAKVVNACVAVARCVGITTWATSDDYSWIPGVFPTEGAGLLFDDNNLPKPAYTAVANALAAATVVGTF